MLIDVIIPTYNPDTKLERIISALTKQTLAPSKIILINSGGPLPDAIRDRGDTVEIINIPEGEFDHGATRNRAAASSKAEKLLFMTQDAVPADANMIGYMVKAFTPGVCAVYARQLANEDASPAERFSRSFNYPEEPCVKSSDDIERLGIKTFFCSNACAMYERADFERLGRFPEGMIFNEDMVFARRIIDDGKKIAYAADAAVYHSHNYTNMQQFRRNFDLAVSQAMHPEVFSDVSSESEGISYVKKAFGRFASDGRPLYCIPFSVACAYRLIGYRLGKRYEKLGKKTILFCTANPNFFNRYWSGKHG